MEELIQNLQALGFGLYESRTLAVLLVESPKTAREISRLGTVPYTKLYIVLSNLEKKGLIYRDDAKPRRYYAKGVDHLIDQMIAYHQDKQKFLEEVRKKIKEEVKNTKLPKLLPRRYYLNPWYF